MPTKPLKQKLVLSRVEKLGLHDLDVFSRKANRIYKAGLFKAKYRPTQNMASDRFEHWKDFPFIIKMEQEMLGDSIVR